MTTPIRRRCVIYYSTVVEDGENSWARNGSHNMEPVKVESEEPLGKQPEFCCKDLKEAVDTFRVTFHDSYDDKTMKLYTSQGGYRQDVDLNFCPFCGAKITFKENLKLKVVETTVPRKTYAFQEV